MFARLAALLLWLAAIALFPASAQQPPPGPAKAVFAAGCFWCLEEAMDKVPGVISTTSGYMGGNKKSPTYEEVSSGGTGHAEVVQIVYDPTKVSYERLLEQFWLNHDPTVKNRQFCDVGSQYRPSVFYYGDEQKRLAEASKARWDKDKPFKQTIVTPIVNATDFWPAEDYHQNYYLRNPLRYKYYVTSCGRYARLDELWGKLRK